MKELVLVLILVLLLSSFITAKRFTHKEAVIDLWTKEFSSGVSSVKPYTAIERMIIDVTVFGSWF